MFVEQRCWTHDSGWTIVRPSPVPIQPHLVLYFGSADLGDAAVALRDFYPNAPLLGCSTAGEICETRVSEGTVVATALQFERTTVRTAHRVIVNRHESASIGRRLASDLDPEGLVHVFALAEGLNVNGSELVKGLRDGLPSSVAVTGGLAGDGERFQRTVVSLDDKDGDGGVAIVGFYGDLRIGYGSMGGWDQFGPERLVTRSEGNVLYELDGASALELYKSYLGPYASELPASGLLFPLSLRMESEHTSVVRTILGIDEKEGSLTFAGDVPQGAYTRLMKANVDRLIDGAHGAAGASYEAVGSSTPDVALLISCVGRKLVLKQRVEEEIESVREVLGEHPVLAGFYSYGEIAPFAPSVKCELHNQTMTITTLSER